uniref:Uncharacterized protein n=1 Tax=viral metagenome TaxID=1070528 RepID=A0A6C0HVE5_9ZZZZ
MNIFITIIKFFGQYIHLEFLTRLILIASLVVSFLTIFFFTFGKEIEHKVVTQNIDYLIDEICDGFVDTMGDKQKKAIYEKINSFKLEDMSKEDEKVETNNKQLFDKSVTILIILLVLSVFITSIISYFKKYNYLEIVTENIILLLFVGLCEFIFLVYFGSKFISANVNFIKGKIASYLYIPNPVTDKNKLIYKLIDNSFNNKNLIKFINENPELANEYINRITVNTNNLQDIINQRITTSSNI